MTSSLSASQPRMIPSASPEHAEMNWLFIDMDSYFASVEQHLRPELRGRTIGVTPVESEGTCVIAASADAKRRGVKVGTPVREARRLCPDIALVKARPATYVEVHHDIIRSIDHCAPIHKVYSIDEWAIRLIGKERRIDDALRLGRDIKRRLLQDFSPWLTCSIGVAPTRLLAKIASDFQKPNGLTSLEPADLPHRLEHLQPDDLVGISRGMLRRLHAANIHTIRDLWNLSRQEARKVWGSVEGERWWCGLHGHDMPEPLTHRHSITHANMLAPEHRNESGAHGILLRLLCKGAVRLRHHGYVAHRLHISVSGYDGFEWGAQAPLEGTQNTLTIVRAFETLWRTRPWADDARTGLFQPSCGFVGRSPQPQFSQVGITLSGLESMSNATPSLFAEEERIRDLSRAMDRINSRWGSHSLYVGSLHDYRHQMDDKIAFGRIPDAHGSA